jgi:four helix bundle protein
LLRSVGRFATEGRPRLRALAVRLRPERFGSEAGETKMINTLKIYADVIGLIRKLRPIVETIAHRDPDLGRQLRRALTSIPLNIAEGAKQNDGNGRARFLTAMGSTNEVAAVLETSEALGYVDAVGEEVIDDLDRIARSLNRLARRKR